MAQEGLESRDRDGKYRNRAQKVHTECATEPDHEFVVQSDRLGVAGRLAMQDSSRCIYGTMTCANYNEVLQGYQ